jgi:hypothetical protein
MKWNNNFCLIDSLNAIFGQYIVGPSLAVALENDAIVLNTIGADTLTIQAISALRSPGWSLETLVAIARLTAVETLEWVATMRPATLERAEFAAPIQNPKDWMDWQKINDLTASEFSRFTGDVNAFDFSGAIFQTQGHYFEVEFRQGFAIKVDGLNANLQQLDCAKFNKLVRDAKSIVFFKVLDKDKCKDTYDKYQAAISAGNTDAAPNATSRGAPSQTPRGT